MKTHRLLIFITCLQVTGPALAASPHCDLKEGMGSRELHRTLSLRAVEVIRLAASSNRRLAELVAPSASFSLGAGDVGRPLGTGVDGAGALAEVMKADAYRFQGWDYMDKPEDVCSTFKVAVQFIDNEAGSESRVEFTFDAGRVVNADGWQRSFETGRL